MSSRACRALVWMVVAVCLGLAAAAPASAQIYAIRDENGVLTLSDKPLGERGRGEGEPQAHGDDHPHERAAGAARHDSLRSVLG